MLNNYKLAYNVDLVLCIDCTESMDNILNIVKERTLGLYDDIQKIMQSKGKTIDRLRVRLVAFRDYAAYADELRRKVHANEPMMVSNFFELPREAYKLEVSVKSLYPVGGGDAEEDGLEALAYAIRSDWLVSTSKDRHVIVLWTDAAPHYLGFGKASPRYPDGMARNFEELTEWWGERDNPGYMPEQTGKRLVLFAPDMGEWSQISACWDNIIHWPSNAGNGLREADYDTILNCIAQSI